MFTIKQAAARVGITEGLLILWISTGKVKPSIELSLRNSDCASIAQRALESFAGPDNEAFGWNRFQLTAEDVENLAAMVERTAKQRTKAESNHVAGSNYTVKELATIWGFSTDKIRELFEDEPGVLKVQSPAKRGKRPYTSIRIPESVASRVQRRMS
jgi:hypothetical protein